MTRDLFAIAKFLFEAGTSHLGHTWHHKMVSGSSFKHFYTCWCKMVQRRPPVTMSVKNLEHYHAVLPPHMGGQRRALVKSISSQFIAYVCTHLRDSAVVTIR